MIQNYLLHKWQSIKNQEPILWRKASFQGSGISQLEPVMWWGPITPLTLTMADLCQEVAFNITSQRGTASTLVCSSKGNESSSLPCSLGVCSTASLPLGSSPFKGCMLGSTRLGSGFVTAHSTNSNKCACPRYETRSKLRLFHFKG